MKWRALLLVAVSVTCSAQLVINNAVIRSASLPGISACVTNVILDFDTGTDGAAVALSALTNSTHGASGTYSYSASALSNFIFSTTGQQNLLNPVNICGIGVFYGNGSVGARSETTNNSAIAVTLSGSYPKISVGWWTKLTMQPSSISFIDSLIVSENGNLGGPGDYANASVESGNDTDGVRFGLEGHSGHPESVGRYATNVWWWRTMLFDRTGSHKLSIYNSSGVFQEELTNPAQAGATNSNTFQIGPAILGQSTPGRYMYIDNLKWSTNGDYPLLP